MAVVLLQANDGCCNHIIWRLHYRNQMVVALPQINGRSNCSNGCFPISICSNCCYPSAATVAIHLQQLLLSICSTLLLFICSNCCFPSAATAAIHLQQLLLFICSNSNCCYPSAATVAFHLQKQLLSVRLQVRIASGGIAVGLQWDCSGIAGGGIVVGLRAVELQWDCSGCLCKQANKQKVQFPVH